MEIKDIRQRVVDQPHFRLMTVNREAVDSEKRTVELSFASENPVERWWGIEILDHSPESVKLERWTNSPPFLENHRLRRGVIEDGRIEDKRLTGRARLSRNQAAEDLLQDIADGIAVHTSVGYIVHDMRELKPEEMSEQVKQMVLASEVKAYRVSWEPLEGSSVDIPADITVGLGKRSLEYYDLKDLSDPQKVLAEIRSFKPPTTEKVGTGDITHIKTKERVMTPENKDLPTPEDVRKEERVRLSEITKWSQKFAGRVENIDDLRDAAISDGSSVEQFKGKIAEAMANREEPIFTPPSEVGMSDKEVKKYSLLRAIQAQIPGSRVKADYEREISDQIAEDTDRKARGMFIPWDVQNRRLTVPAQERETLAKLALRHGLSHAYRDLTVGGAGTGAELVGTSLVASSFIELLRNRSVASKVGVQTLFGMVGNFSLPRQTSAGTFYWTGETGTTTESTLGTGDIDFSPKEGAAYQEYSRMLLLQSTPSVELLLQNDLLAVARLGIDAAVFHGTGSSNQPTGIANESGVGSVNGATLGWEGVVEFETDVMSGNADVDSMFYVTNPTVRGLLKTRPYFANSPFPIWGPDGMVNGYQTVVSNQINSGHMFFGDFSQELLAYWGNLDILVNPYSLDTTRHIRVSIAADVDCHLRQAAAISLSSTIT